MEEDHKYSSASEPIQDGGPYFTGEQGNNKESEKTDMNLINLTQHTLGLDHLSVLGRGLGFSPCNKGNPFDIYKDI